MFYVNLHLFHRLFSRTLPLQSMLSGRCFSKFTLGVEGRGHQLNRHANTPANSFFLYPKLVGQELHNVVFLRAQYFVNIKGASIFFFFFHSLCSTISFETLPPQVHALSDSLL